jgi:4-amino-4-deoxy-L-arabinose transferase-like glycosyltransferase
MNEYIVILIFVLWYSFSLIVSETLGKKKQMGVQWSFFLCMLLSPIVGYIALLVSPDALNHAK